MNRSLVALLLLPAVVSAAPVPKGNDSERLLVVTADHKVTLHTLDGKNPKVVAEAGEKGSLLAAVLSPDGKRLAFAAKIQGMYGDTVIRQRVIADDKPTDLATIPGKGKGQLLPLVSVHSLFWSPDGKSLAGTCRDRFAKQQPPALSGEWTNFRIDATTGDRTDLHTNTEYRAIAFTPDGKALVCTRGFNKPPVNNTQVIGFETAVLPTDKVVPEVMIADALDLRPVAAFPDGKRWVVISHGQPDRVGVYTTGEKKPAWWDVDLQDWHVPAAVSPDGKRVVYALHPRWVKDKPEKSVVWVADADGTNAAQLWESDRKVMSLDWR